LYAVGYVNGKEVSRDDIVLNHLPRAPHFNDFFKDAKPITSPQPRYNYLYRVNCGGPDYVDENGNKWMADRQRTGNKFWGSTSWTKDFPGMPAYFASQRRTFDPIHGTKDWKLFQTFRYGREKLHYDFPVPDGDYLVELYFTEPWFGRGGGINCKGWRLFDVAVNDKVVLKNEDIWKEAGYSTALKKTMKVTVKGGLLTISFPRVASGQAVISAIAIASLDQNSKPAKPSPSLIQNLEVNNKSATKDWVLESWLDTGEKQYVDDNVAFSALSSELYGAEWIQTPKILKGAKNSTIATFTVGNDADIFIGVNTKIITIPEWLKDYENTNTFIENDFNGGQRFAVYRKRFKKDEIISLGDNGGMDNKTSMMYPIVVLPVSNMQPAYDLKPVTNYKAVAGKLYGPGLVKGIINGKDRVIFSKPSTENLLEWKFDVDVADMYSLTISYNNPNANTINGTLEIFSEDGTLLKKEDVEFKATRPGKSNYISTTTGTMINAGKYTVQLRAKDAKGLSINSLDVQ
jgi:beta-galactosidase